MEQRIKVGAIVRTPTGRPGLVIGMFFGARGDLPRASVRYLDVVSESDGVALQPSLLQLWKEDGPDRRQKQKAENERQAAPVC